MEIDILNVYNSNSREMILLFQFYNLLLMGIWVYLLVNHKVLVDKGLIGQISIAVNVKYFLVYMHIWYTYLKNY